MIAHVFLEISVLGWIYRGETAWSLNLDHYIPYLRHSACSESSLIQRLLENKCTSYRGGNEVAGEDSMSYTLDLLISVP